MAKSGGNQVPERAEEKAGGDKEASLTKATQEGQSITFEKQFVLGILFRSGLFLARLDLLPRTDDCIGALIVASATYAFFKKQTCQ